MGRCLTEIESVRVTFNLRTVDFDLIIDYDVTQLSTAKYFPSLQSGSVPCTCRCHLRATWCSAPDIRAFVYSVRGSSKRVQDCARTFSTNYSNELVSFFLICHSKTRLKTIESLNFLI